MREPTEDMRHVEDVCGKTIADELLARLPGLMLYVPKVDHDREPLNHLTRTTIDALIAEVGGSWIYVKSKRPTYRQTFAAVEKLIDEGLPVWKIALKLGYTEHWIRTVRRKSGAPGLKEKIRARQLSFFDQN